MTSILGETRVTSTHTRRERERKRFVALVTVGTVIQRQHIYSAVIGMCHRRVGLISQADVPHVLQMLDGIDPELFGDLVIAGVAQAAQLSAMPFDEARHALDVQIQRVADVDRAQVR